MKNHDDDTADISMVSFAVMEVLGLVICANAAELSVMMAHPRTWARPDPTNIELLMQIFVRRGVVQQFDYCDITYYAHGQIPAEKVWEKLKSNPPH